MKKIVIIGVFFGKFPNSFKIWLKSCEYNSTIDFKIFTNQKMVSNLKNLEYINMEFEDFNALIKEKIRKDFFCSYPYKCCDFKPTYGIVFEDYIKKYDFWGYCDFDMVFGDIRKFITDNIMNSYDKILSLGHLSLYKNTKKNNERFKDKGSKIGNYDFIYTNDKNLAFDEDLGIKEIYLYNNYPIYDEIIFADISIIRKRFTLARKGKNYKQQIFYWENGHVYRAYSDSNRIKTDEFVYIHFKRRKYIPDLIKNPNCNSFYICDFGFIEKEPGIPSIEDIKKYNKYPGKVHESIENTIYKLRIKRDKIKISFNKIFKK